MIANQTLEKLVLIGSRGHGPRAVTFEEDPRITALGRAGTSHVYADTADVGEVAKTAEPREEVLLAGIDGNTVNQPLLAKVADRYLEAGDVPRWAEEIRDRQEMDDHELVPLIYAVLLSQVTHDMIGRFAGGRGWEPNAQIHMGSIGEPRSAREFARTLAKMAGRVIVKVPFAPHLPHSLLVARDLEREGIRVNLTSTFSARQAVAAALLANVSRTNIFMGRLNQGLDATFLGEHVDLSAQRAILHLRRTAGVRTMLIVASIHDWRTFTRAAGCDVFTAPCPVIADLLAQEELVPSDIPSRLTTSYEDDMAIGTRAAQRLGAEGVSRLWRVEDEFIEFLDELRRSPEYDGMTDGHQLFEAFETAGFADFFHAPTPGEWKAIRESKLPDLDGPLAGRVPIDTLFSLHAHADFEKHQKDIDERIRRRLRGESAR